VETFQGSVLNLYHEQTSSNQNVPNVWYAFHVY